MITKIIAIHERTRLKRVQDYVKDKEKTIQTDISKQGIHN